MILDPASQMVDLQYFGGQETLLRLQNFLDSGATPAYVGWGSMPADVAFLVKAIVALKMNKLRAIVVGGWAKLSEQKVKDFVEQTMPDDPMGVLDYAREHILFVEVAPHEWLFQRCLFTLHHGGAGTTQAALRAGVPTILSPFSFDQFQFADWVTDLGVGIKIGLLDNPDKLMDPQWSKAFRLCANDKAMRQRSKEFAEVIKKERGAHTLVEHFKESLKPREEGKKKTFGF